MRPALSQHRCWEECWDGAVAKLTAKKVENLRAPGFHGHGEGLYLKVGTGRAKSWILRTVVHGRRRDRAKDMASDYEQRDPALTMPNGAAIPYASV